MSKLVDDLCDWEPSGTVGRLTHAAANRILALEMALREIATIRGSSFRTYKQDFDDAQRIARTSLAGSPLSDAAEQALADGSATNRTKGDET
jgi:hypothetical protein